MIRKAVELFRDRGFAGTSADALVEEIGVNRYSRYAEFGSKQGLFNAVAQRYDNAVLERIFDPLESPGAGIEKIRALLGLYGLASKNLSWGRGCMPCNTAVKFGANDPSGGGLVNWYFERLCAAFHTALAKPSPKGKIRRPPTPERRRDSLPFPCPECSSC